MFQREEKSIGEEHGAEVANTGIEGQMKRAKPKDTGDGEEEDEEMENDSEKEKEEREHQEKEEEENQQKGRIPTSQGIVAKFAQAFMLTERAAEAERTGRRLLRP